MNVNQMNSSKKQGNGWPNPEQKLLLQACLLPDSAAQYAWNTWKNLIDLDFLEPASLKLLPLVCRNPSMQGLKDPVLDKCRGFYRKTWITNQLKWKQAVIFLNYLTEHKEIKIILLKGIAMILAYYEDFGVRPIGDIDILLKPRDLSIAKSIFTQLGLKQHDPHLDLENPDHIGRWHAMSFLDKTDHDLDLHWSFIHEQVPLLDKAVWDKAKPLSTHPAFHIPTPTHLFLQTCIHGFKHSPIPLIRWIADAMTILRKKAIDWDEFVFLSKSAHIALPMSHALEYLTLEFAAPIPDSTVSALRSTPIHWLELREYQSYSRGHTYTANWYRYCLNRGLWTYRLQILHIHKYLQITARLKSAWWIPFFSVYWVMKRIKRRLIALGAIPKSIQRIFTLQRMKKSKNFIN